MQLGCTVRRSVDPSAPAVLVAVHLLRVKRHETPGANHAILTSPIEAFLRRRDHARQSDRPSVLRL